MEERIVIYESNANFVRGKSLFCKAVQDEKIRLCFSSLALAFFAYACVDYYLKGQLNNCIIFSIFFIATLIYIYTAFEDVFCAVRATRARVLLNGKIVKSILHPYGEFSGFRLTIDFENPKGDKLEFITDIADNPRRADVGDTCFVLYLDDSHFYAM